MRCFSCLKISLTIICKVCQKDILTPRITKREIGDLSIFSFFRYSDIEPLLLSKHKPEGFRIFRLFGDLIMRPFIDEWIESMPEQVYIIGIDENIKNGYSHIALLTHAMKRKLATPQHSSLLAINRVKYAGKSLDFRLDNPRGFVYNGLSDIDVILVDDIITTGLTIQEAKEKLEDNGVRVLFAITLADARNS